MPKLAPDMKLRRGEIVQTTRTLAEREGWTAVTMRRLAAHLGVTQPFIYSAFDGRQALIDAVALQGFEQLASALVAAEPTPLDRIRA